jgi:hypothetical protein
MMLSRSSGSVNAGTREDVEKRVEIWLGETGSSWPVNYFLRPIESGTQTSPSKPNQQASTQTQTEHSPVMLAGRPISQIASVPRDLDHPVRDLSDVVV